MAHYVTKPTQKSLKYYIFSTITMCPITKKMYRAEMLDYLKDNDYTDWVNPKPWDENAKRKCNYWNGDFWFVTEEDNYYV